MAIPSKKILAKFNAEAKKFDWIKEWTHPTTPDGFYEEAIDNYFIKHSDYRTYVFNLETGEVIHNVTTLYQPNKETSFTNGTDSYVYKVGNKIYQYIFAYDRFITVELSGNKPVNHITINNNLDTNSFSFEGEVIANPSFAMIDNRFALGGDTKYFYIVDLIDGEIKHKISKAEVAAIDQNTG
jgi:hypothetical protein